MAKTDQIAEAAAAVDYQSATAVKLVGEGGEVLPLEIDAKGRLVIAGVSIGAGAAETLVTTIAAWQAKGTFEDVEAGKIAARAFTIDEAAAEWKQRYLANPKTRGDQISVGAKEARTIIGVGPDFFYLDDGQQLPFSAAAAHATWLTDGAAVGVAK